MPKRQSGISTGRVVALLVFFPPAGIVLARIHQPWSETTRKQAAIASAAWMILALATGRLVDGRPAAPRAKPQAAQSTGRAVPPSKTEAKVRVEGAPRAPTVDAVHHRLQAVIPPELQEFVLIATDVHPTPLPGMDLPETGIWARYVSESDPDFRVEVLANKVPEPASAGRSAKRLDIHGHAGLMTVDPETGQVAVVWRSADYLFVTWVNGGGAAGRKAAKQRAPVVARAIATYADSAVDALTDREVASRAAAVVSALESAASVLARRKARLQRMAHQLPDWATAVAYSKGSDDEARITVQLDWLALPRLVREEQARAVWRSWAKINSPVNLARSSVRFVTQSGKDIGGSGIVQTSTITLDE